MKTNSFQFSFLLTISIIFISFVSANSQVNFEPGYILQQNGDTTHGYIDDRHWKINPDYIYFNPGHDGLTMRYGPSAIAGFGMRGAIYKSAAVDREQALNSFGTQKFESTVLTKRDTVFLKTLIGGTKRLLYLGDENEYNQFYIDQDGKYTLLLYKRYLKMQDGKTGYLENRTYIGQLIDYLKDCPGIAGELTEIKYKRKELQQLFLNYYSCIHSSAVFQSIKEKITTQTGFLIGMSNTKINLKKTNPYAGVTFNSSSMISGGLYLDQVYPFNQHKYSWHNELIFTSYTIDGHYDDHLNPASIHAQYAYVKANSLIRYTSPVKNISPFAGFGISIGIPVSGKNEVIDESVFHPGINSQLYGVGGGELAFVLEGGLKYKRYLLEFHYERNSLNSATRSYIFLGYRF